MTRAVVVGSGPNGLAAALRLAGEGIEVVVLEAADRPGGGSRTSETTIPGLLHDDCSAVHPMGVLSPYLSTLGLDRFGLTWRWPDVDLAHPLDDGRAAVLSRTPERTVASLGADGPAWWRLFEPIVRDLDLLLQDAFRPLAHVPQHPIALARFGLRALEPASVFVRRWDDDPAKALFTGAAAHAFGRLDRPLSASVGLLLAAAGHLGGWPVAEGGSQAISTAMLALLAERGGTVRTGVEVTSLAQVADAAGGAPDVVLLDTSPSAAVRIAGDRLSGRVRRSLGRYRYGPAAFKVDFALSGEVPWSHPDVRRAGTVHVGGSAAEIAANEGLTSLGIMPERPFVLVAQQHVADPTRAADGHVPLWAYAHVPHDWTGDATEAIVRQIERFAPGFRDRIVMSVPRGPQAMAAYNANYVGGDIGVGANTPRQILVRPRIALDPYRLADGLYLCSAATPPGAGVHGMCGFHAAGSALARL